MSAFVLVTVPIGNDLDITLSAIKDLKEIKYFFVEDTRVFKELLKRLQISFEDKVIDSFHDHSDLKKIDKILDLIKTGNRVGFASDAGSPVISDPAYPILKKLQEEKVKIESSSGISAVLCALELSCLPTNPFHFWGFPSRSKGEQLAFFQKLGQIYGTHIFFESPHRVEETLENYFSTFENGSIVVTKELRKDYQNVVTVTKKEMHKIKDLIVLKGEFVLLFYNELDNKYSDPAILKEINSYIEIGGSTKKLAKIFSMLTNEDTQVLYQKLARNKKAF